MVKLMKHERLGRLMGKEEEEEEEEMVLRRTSRGYIYLREALLLRAHASTCYASDDL